MLTLLKYPKQINHIALLYLTVNFQLLVALQLQLKDNIIQYITLQMMANNCYIINCEITVHNCPFTVIYVKFLIVNYCESNAISSQ